MAQPFFFSTVYLSAPLLLAWILAAFGGYPRVGLAARWSLFAIACLFWVAHALTHRDWLAARKQQHELHRIGSGVPGYLNEFLAFNRPQYWGWIACTVAALVIPQIGWKWRLLIIGVGAIPDAIVFRKESFGTGDPVMPFLPIVAFLGILRGIAFILPYVAGVSAVLGIVGAALAANSFLNGAPPDDFFAKHVAAFVLCVAVGLLIVFSRRVLMRFVDHLFGRLDTAIARREKRREQKSASHEAKINLPSN